MDRHPESRDQSHGQDSASQLPRNRPRRTSTISLESGLSSDQRDQSRRVRQDAVSAARPALPPPPEYSDQCNGVGPDSDFEPSPVSSSHPTSISSPSPRRAWSSAAYPAPWDDAERRSPQTDMVQSPQDMELDGSDASNEPAQGATHAAGVSAGSNVTHTPPVGQQADAANAFTVDAQTEAQAAPPSPMDIDSDEVPVNSGSPGSRDGITPTPETAPKDSSN